MCSSLESVIAFSTPSGRPKVGAATTAEEPSNKATQILQGIGPVQVDLNQYNLDSLEDIAMEWTANLKQKISEKEVKAVLGVRNATELFVDTVEILLPRQPGQGLGLELAEIAGGRDDGLGISLITGVVEGGPTDGLDILPGDSISKITLLRRQTTTGDALSEVQEAIPVRTECLGFDATVNAIQSLPDCSESMDETLQLSLRRIRRKPRVTVKLQYPPSQKEQDATLELFAGENLRMGMLIRGVKLNDPLAKRFDTKNGGR